MRRVIGLKILRFLSMNFVVVGVLVPAFGVPLPEKETQDPAVAQQQAMQQKAAAIKESMAKNQVSLRQYSWTETTEVSLKGEVKKRERKSCRYDPDGKVQKTTTSSGDEGTDKQEKSGGRRNRRAGGAIKGAIVEKKVDDLKEYMGQVSALVHEYVPPDPGKIQSCMASGKIDADKTDSGGLTALTFSDFVKPQDQVKLAFDPASRRLTSYEVFSYTEKPEDTVTLTVKFDSLPDGTNYPKETVLDAGKKNIVVRITNSEYQKAAP